MIKWTKQNDEKLASLWNAGKTDNEISEIFNAGTYAITKRRSILGFVKYKNKEGLTHCKKSDVPIQNKMFFVAHYQKDGLNHFSYLETEDEKKAKTLIRNLIYKQGISSVTLLKPTTKLVLKTITEVKL